jgi:hypothetical protein
MARSSCNLQYAYTGNRYAPNATHIITARCAYAQRAVRIYAPAAAG